MANTQPLFRESSSNLPNVRLKPSRKALLNAALSLTGSLPNAVRKVPKIFSSSVGSCEGPAASAVGLRLMRGGGFGGFTISSEADTRNDLRKRRRNTKWKLIPS